MSRQMYIYWYTTTKDFADIQAGKTYCIGEADPYADRYAGLSIENAVKKRIKEGRAD